MPMTIRQPNKTASEQPTNRLAMLAKIAMKGPGRTTRSGTGRRSAPQVTKERD